ncbi:DNA-3-methyladenine glycosylase family protein [Gordonia phthalatica]|uniref:DNA-3-methyladenine glycosylase II n=1 Tax=Gordonia phthalatica TaxID=1136941 RepID=A0A0N9MNS9_9ACTN|nr:AlkA N-terminal domain-containing protein [Gordonia phthalatica]ALG84437.1 hypothetical protein ACH46_07915 [Gordonia phthalatica]
MSRIRLDANGPFDHRAALAVLAAHRTEGVERVDDRGITRLLTVGDDDHLVTVALDPAGALATVDTADTRVHAAVADRIRRWFDLDADLDAVNDVLAADPMFADHVAQRPGLRITRCADAFETVVETVLGQQVTLAAARLFDARLVAAYGADGPSGLRRFPTPASLLAVPVDELRATLRVTGARAKTVHEVAGFFVDREPGGPLPERSDLAALYGIGPWTLDYLAVRAGDDTDAFPATDAVLRRMLSAHGIGADAVERWCPVRSYAAVRLWAMSGALD